MPHPDAIGYLYDLARRIGEDWFKAICDFAVNGVTLLDEEKTQTLFALIANQEPYRSSGAQTPQVSPTPPPAPGDFLELLCSFSNFKRLQSDLQITFTKRITLMFGANGSGKSSLCEALKLLASTDPPTRPLINVLGTSSIEPQFKFKFISDSTLQTWTPAAGYGSRTSTIKYFDTGIAIRNVIDSVEPGRLIELKPFKLQVFELAKTLTVEFRQAITRKKADITRKLKEGLTKIVTDFADFGGRPLASIEESSVSVLSSEIEIGGAFNQHDLLNTKLAELSALEKATSQEGLRLLRAEYRELDEFLSSLNNLIVSATTLWNIKSAEKAYELAEKQKAQELIASMLIPENGTLELLISLLNAASSLCNFDAEENSVCPLCRRQLSASEITLFKQYHDLLCGQLEEGISALRVQLKEAQTLVQTIQGINPSVWDKSSTLPPDIATAAKGTAQLIVDNCAIDKDPTGQALEALTFLKTLHTDGTKLLEQKSRAISAATGDASQLQKEITKLNQEIEPLRYANLISANLPTLKAVQLLAKEAAFWDSKLPGFTGVLRRVTESSKAAHEELVVSDFETRLNNEYLALTERSMAAFGVILRKRGSEASVTVRPEIGGNDLGGVLSEGEQRVHSLSLFFAELNTSPQSVIVFDDPISSFDYNYIANYCTRLRDFVIQNPQKQVIVLTHNWEFFVQLQLTLSQGGLSHSMSVQVLENCSAAADYSENIAELKSNIEAILSQSSEPARHQKEQLAGTMRRLIEAIVNTHVFNGQRNQYKQKRQQVSAFIECTKIVSLLDNEARDLRDFFAKLSMSEHDDPRNAYVNTDRATFRSRYDKILAIEAAIVLRKLGSAP